MTTYVVAPSHAQAQAAIIAQGLGIWKPTIVTDPIKLQGIGGGTSTILVYNRRFLSAAMQNALSVHGQRCLTVEMAEVDRPNDLTQAPWSALAQELVDRKVKRVAFRDENRDRDMILTIKDALDPPEFETAEQALAWLDQVEDGTIAQVASGSSGS